MIENRPQPNILYQDEHLIAIDKPSGMLVHPSPIDKRETWIASDWVAETTGKKPFGIHRLDKATSGLLLFAFDSQTAQALCTDFENQNIDKTYHAIVRGYCPESGEIDHPLKVKAPFRSDQAEADLKLPQQALTHYKRLATVELSLPVDHYPVARYSLIEVKPKSGRKHQIRRHFKHLSHPLVGDTSYGKSVHNRFFQQHFAINRLLLAAVSLTFTHPHSNAQMTLKCPLADELKELYGQLGWSEFVC